MFTGIVTDLGEVLALEQRGDLRARIGTSYPVDGIDIGHFDPQRAARRG